MATFLFSYLVLSLCILSVSANNPLFLSIDCGSSDSYEDENSIAWVGDGNYIKTGESYPVQIPKYTARSMNTVRVFTTRRKNCYHIDSVKQGERVLVRANFLYGNYDSKSSPPKFDLFIEGTHWQRVENPIWGIVSHEVIYVTKKDSISVCLAQSSLYPDQFPFISALEVRGLTFSMYQYQYRDNADDYPLFLSKRVAFGSNQTIRYPSDPYDRIWSNSDMNYVSLTPVSNTANNLSNLVQKGEEPPPAVLKHGVTAAPPNSSIVISLGIYYPVHYIAYFSEVTQLKPNEKRSFTISIDNGPSSEPIIPPFGDYIAKYGDNITFKLTADLYITPTHDSTLPPLINALEIFSIGDALNNTNDKDVQGLASLQKAFPILQEWSGDPCLPIVYEWEWVLCQHYSEDPPRVVGLSLGSYGLSGVIPDFSSMDALKTIVLRNNSLKGPIPDFFARLPQLVLLDLRDNQLNGTVPASVLTKLGGNLAVSGNADLCVPGKSCEASSSRKMNTNFMTIFFGSIIPSVMIYAWL